MLCSWCCHGDGDILLSGGEDNVLGERGFSLVLFSFKGNVIPTLAMYIVGPSPLSASQFFLQYSTPLMKCRILSLLTVYLEVYECVFLWIWPLWSWWFWARGGQKGCRGRSDLPVMTDAPLIITIPSLKTALSGMASYSLHGALLPLGRWSKVVHYYP
jgi:hypothetical protein